MHVCVCVWVCACVYVCVFISCTIFGFCGRLPVVSTCHREREKVRYILDLAGIFPATS